MPSDKERSDKEQQQEVPFWYRLSWLLSDWLQKAVNGVGWVMLFVTSPGRALALPRQLNRDAAVSALEAQGVEKPVEIREWLRQVGCTDERIINEPAKALVNEFVQAWYEQLDAEGQAEVLEWRDELLQTDKEVPPSSTS